MGPKLPPPPPHPRREGIRDIVYPVIHWQPRRRCASTKERHCGPPIASRHTMRTTCAGFSLRTVSRASWLPDVPHLVVSPVCLYGHRRFGTPGSYVNPPPHIGNAKVFAGFRVFFVLYFPRAFAIGLSKVTGGHFIGFPMRHA